MFSFSSLSSLEFDFPISSLFFRIQFLLKNVSTVSVSINPLFIAVLFVRSVQVNKRVFRVSRFSFSFSLELFRFSTFLDC